LREYFARLRDVQLEIGGADLMALGLAESPRIGEILGELRRRKLNGELPGRDDELAAARELATAVLPA
jgi:tRNA nucleotidyltransferase (CCA-adding enzyme)